jgi:hypothetical protein
MLIKSCMIEVCNNITRLFVVGDWLGNHTLTNMPHNIMHTASYSKQDHWRFHSIYCLQYHCFHYLSCMMVYSSVLINHLPKGKQLVTDL